MTHDDFVREYAASVDRMMATKAVRLNLAEDFQSAWRFLTDMHVHDFASVKIGRVPSGSAGSDEHRVRQDKNDPRRQGLWGADSNAVHRTITKDEYELAKKYGASLVDELPVGWG